ncbi:probable lysosomal cobalamin transporter isoform X1 [Limulus polyphemus]|uniref:Probable lysosomal cobalamin transporter isoform X1 n=2 Tax=Limulus polyphemus TaxID=6850 RepID=A0ABM1BKM3_LIMPO|nr:probable lysosomal cobalamin transporter isoform X1 [Limulus polyphemus]
MAIPGGFVAAGWIPFVIILTGTLLFSFLYVRFFHSRYDSDRSTTVTSILALSVTLLTSLLLPVDVFLASYMKNSDGTFKDWASNITFRHTVEDSVLYAYYALYSIVVFFAFFLLPFIYFFFEEKDDGENHVGSRLCTALKYTIVFLLVGAVLLLIGAFIPMKKAPPKNSTEWEKLEFIVNELGQNRGEDALSFILGVLSLIGMLYFIIYTGCGISSWPIHLFRGTRSAAAEQDDVTNQREITTSRITNLRDKYQNKKKLSSREQSDLAELQENEHLLSRRERHLKNLRESLTYKCRCIIRPFQMVIGILGALLGFLLWISLLLSNIDKAINSLGYKMGYAQTQPNLPNPFDFVLVHAQKVFPVDYVIFVCVLIYLVLFTISGIRNLGIWCFCVRMYKIRPRRTPPQGMLMLCSILMYTILAINIFLYSVSPQYTTYGSQQYIANITNATGNSTGQALKRCSSEALPDECTMTRASFLLLRFFYKAWFFGAAYYWAMWVFLLVTVIAFFVTIIRKRRSSIEGLVEDDDLEESDDDMLRA